MKKSLALIALFILITSFLSSCGEGTDSTQTNQQAGDVTQNNAEATWSASTWDKAVWNP